MVWLHASKYFRVGSIFGILIEFLVVFTLMGRSFLEMIDKASLSIPMIGGGIITFWVGVVADRKRNQNQKAISLLNTTAVAVSSFASGTLIGCLMNFLLNGEIFPARFGYFQAFDSLFVRPIVGLGVVGLPLSGLVAVVYFYGTRFLRDKA